MSKSPLESTWLYHEIGRCYLELGEYAEAKKYGEQSETAAVEAEDQMWQLQASVLTAQAEGIFLNFTVHKFHLHLDCCGSGILEDNLEI